MLVLSEVEGLYVGMGIAFAQSEDEAVNLYQKGNGALQCGRHQEALDYFERSLKIYRRLNW